MLTNFSNSASEINKNKFYDFGCNSAITDPTYLKEIIPNIIHFIWLGSNNPDVDLYMRIWQNFNTDKEVILWQDADSEKCMDFQDYLSKYVSQSCTVKEDVEEALLNIRNEAFHFIWGGILKGGDLRNLLDHFLKIKNIKKQDAPVMRQKVTASNIKVRDINELISIEDCFLRKVYYCELILRGNLACASDIIRLLALWKYGGVYIDVDTLPEINLNFRQTNVYLKEQSLFEDESLSILKSAAFLMKFSGKENIECSLKTYASELHALDEHVKNEAIKLICRDLSACRELKVKALGNVYVYKGLISLSTLPFLNGVFFSNVICSAPASRLIRIMLGYISRSYKFLEQNGRLYDSCECTQPLRVNSLMPAQYRKDRLGDSTYVTMKLTGPDMIIRTVIRYLHKVLHIDKNNMHEGLIIKLQDECIGIGFTRQTLDTPFGTISEWRN